MASPAQRALLILGIGAAILAAGLGVALWSLSAGVQGDQAGAASIGGDFTLIDQNGQERHASDFHGRLMLIYFGYTYCPDVCPTELQAMSEAVDLLGDKADAVQPIFVTVDPERDTPEQLRLYAESFHPRLVALTGSADQVAAAARAYKVYYAKRPQADGDYLMDHSSFIFLMGRDGKYLLHFVPGTTPEEMAAAIQKRL